MRVVVDTNVLISAVLSPFGLPAELLDRWEIGDFELITSTALLDELRRVLGYAHIRTLHRLDEEALDQRVERFRQEATLVEPIERLAVVEQDESDNRFFECAVAGEAQIVVSGDRHLLNVGEYQGVQVLTPAAFVSYLDTVSREP